MSVLPSGDMDGLAPVPTNRGSPPDTATTYTASVVPAGVLVGFGFSPRPFAPPPREYAMAAPSPLQARSAISWPSSRVYAVSCRALKSGPSAIQMLRMPRASKVQAILLPEGDAIRSAGKGALRTWSTEKGLVANAAA